MNNPNKADEGSEGRRSMQPTIIIKYTCQETLESLPDIYIENLKQAVALCQDNDDRLEEIRIELLNVAAEIEEYRGRIWAKKTGFIGIRKETDYAE